MSVERQWPNFEWSPEAIEAAGRALREGHPHFVHSDASAQEILNAALRAQPVVALPPCPTCRGAKRWTEGPVGPQTVGMEVTGRTHLCPACHGSGADRMVPEADLCVWIEQNRPNSEFVQMARDGDEYSASNASLLAHDDIFTSLSSFLDSLHAKPGTDRSER